MNPSTSNLIMCQVSAPGKVILHGEHSVVYKKTAIAASLGMRTKATIQENACAKNVICVNLNNLQVKDLIFDFDDVEMNIISKMHVSWYEPKNVDHDVYLNVVKSYVDEYAKNKNITDNQRQAIVIILYAFCAMMSDTRDEFTPIDISVETDLNIGSGIGSSASYSVSLVGVMLQYLRMKNPKKYQAQLTDSDRSNKTFSATEKTLISEWAFNCEKISHGNPSGIDNAVCTYGSLIEFKIGTEIKSHILNSRMKICLINTNVTRNTKNLVKGVAMLRENHQAVIDCVLDACDSLAKEALQVLQDIGRSEDAHENYKKLSELFNLNHNLLRTLGVSHPSLETAYNTSNDLGFGCKLTGAGGGGFAIALIPPSANEEQIDKLVNAISAHGLNTQVTQLGGEGVRIDS